MNQTASVEIELDDAAPAAARRMVRSLLAQWGVGEADTVATAQLLVSELVTGAVHASAPHERVQLELVRDDSSLRLGLVDVSGNVGVPRPRSADDDDDGTLARRAMLLNRLASRWGVEPAPGRSGTRVYAVLPLPVATRS